MEVFIGLVLIVTTVISTVSVLQWKFVKQHLDELKDANSSISMLWHGHGKRKLN